MNAPTATVLRGSSAINEVRELLDQLALVDALAAQCEMATEEQDLSVNITISNDEVTEVIARRRAVITNKLENKGIRIAPDVDLSV